MKKLIGYPLLILSVFLLLYAFFSYSSGLINTSLALLQETSTESAYIAQILGLFTIFLIPLSIIASPLLVLYYQGDWSEIIFIIIIFALLWLANKLLTVKYRIQKPRDLHITENNLPQISRYDTLKALASIPLVYFSVIFGASLTVVIGVVLIFLIYYGEASATGRVHYGILLLIGIGALYGIAAAFFAIINSFRRKHDLTIGVFVKDSNSNIYKVTREVANRVNAKMPQNILVVYEPDFHVQEAYTKLATGEVITGNTLTIGYPFLKYLAVDEIKAVIAHEMAHFTGKDTVFSVRVAPAYRSLKHWLTNLGSIAESDGENSGWVKLPNLLTIFLSAKVFIWFSKHLSRVDRVREARADMIGAICYGTNTFANALKKVKQVGTVFTEASNKDQFQLISEHNKYFTNFYQYFDKNYMGSSKIKNLFEEIIKNDKITSEFDSHYSYAERIAYLPDDNEVKYATSQRLLAKEEAEKYEKKLSELYAVYMQNIVGIVKEVQKQQEQAQAAEAERVKLQEERKASGAMPKCPKCGREYAESWKTCNYCNVELI